MAGAGSREQGPHSHKSHYKSLPQLGHRCPLLAAPRNLQYTAWPYPPTLPGPLAMAWLEGGNHQGSSLPGRVQPPFASVPLPSSGLLNKQGVFPAPAGGGTSPHPHHHPLPWVLQPSKGLSPPRALGAIALAGTCLADQPWPCSNPWFNDGQTCPPRSPITGGT